MRKPAYFLILFIAITLRLATSQSCVPRRMEYGTVCVCNNTYCDTLDTPMPTVKNQLVMITSSEDGHRFSHSTGQFSKMSKAPKSSSHLYVNRTKTYQKIRGFGTSITTAVSYNLQRLPPKLRDCVYRSYFSNDHGMGMNTIRLPIVVLIVILDLGPITNIPKMMCILAILHAWSRENSIEMSN